jgi:hypothetical protein
MKLHEETKYLLWCWATLITIALSLIMDSVSNLEGILFALSLINFGMLSAYARGKNKLSGWPKVKELK